MHNVSLDFLLSVALNVQMVILYAILRRCFHRSDDPTNSVSALKDGGYWLVVSADYTSE